MTGIAKRLVLLTLVTCASLAVAACGGGSDDAGPPQGAATSAETQAAATTEAAATSAPTTAGAAGQTVRFALVETGPKDDGGWNSVYLRGVEQLNAELPDVETTIVADVNPGSQGQKTLETLAQQGYNLIVANGNFAADVDKVAPGYPETRFMSVYDDDVLPNKSVYGARDEEGGYLNGIVAGSMTSSGIIGYVGSYPFPATIKVLDAFALGIRSVNPDATVKVLWVNSYYDPTKEKQAAEALVAAGADILMQDNSSPAVPSVAEQKGLGLLGWATSKEAQAPNAWLGGFVYDWGPYFVAWSKALQDGTLESQIFLEGLETGVVGLAPFGSKVPQDVIDRVEKAKQEIIDGSLEVFAGPIRDNTGKVVVDEGDVVDTAEELNACCAWLVEGVDGTTGG